MKKKEIIIGLLVLLCAVIGLLALKLTSRTDADQVTVMLDGEVYGTYSLKENQEITVDEDEFYNVICIEDGEVHMEDANCPDRYCVEQGAIKGTHQSIVCLPHKLVVEVTKLTSQETEADVVAK